MFLASNDGKLKDTETGKSLELVSFDSNSDGFNSSKSEVQIIGQLRYEYTLNLIHKLGASMTRVGLDFIVPKIA
jgi:hypothetical protein